MDRINIGFLGGCINNQPGINREDLYYSIISKLLTSNQKNEYQISLGSYLSFDRLHEQTKKFITRKQPNFLYLFIRPQPLMPLQKPIVKYDRAEKKTGYAFHPALITRQLIWKEEFSSYQPAYDFQFVNKRDFGFRSINLLTGVVLGLHHWALKYLAHQLGLVKQLCTEKNIKLKIISPPQNPESFLANLTCKWIAKYLHKYCKSADIDFINVNTFSLADFDQDKIHFNIPGHKKLGELIYQDIDLEGNGSAANIRLDERLKKRLSL
ncbi:MAG TPA: hypothetical protein VI731_10595 [Bacteroidia bacterium]|nr:hypothetical protein [Bacteroidia bacterium]